ncbi:uncharacterized protein G2W53_028794 [Senna tora]|uniref:Uncharacterized protein n=1 Tax=Senna tora TaxID=362788 RepID=A0A834T3D9_9FABA|nr:uncharacterized protein G2W53_028794 [Senna tora]
MTHEYNVPKDLASPGTVQANTLRFVTSIPQIEKCISNNLEWRTSDRLKLELKFTYPASGVDGGRQLSRGQRW